MLTWWALKHSHYYWIHLKLSIKLALKLNIAQGVVQHWKILSPSQKFCRHQLPPREITTNLCEKVLKQIHWLEDLNRLVF